MGPRSLKATEYVLSGVRDTRKREAENGEPKARVDLDAINLGASPATVARAY